MFHFTKKVYIGIICSFVVIVFSVYFFYQYYSLDKRYVFSDFLTPQEQDEIAFEVTSGEFMRANKKIDVQIEKLNTILNQNVGSGSSNNLYSSGKITEKSIKVAISELLYIKSSNILNNGNYFYTEKQSVKELQSTINKIELLGPDYIDPFYHNFYLGYAKEISKDYTGALLNYNLALESAKDIQKNKKMRSIILNQIGHVYDLFMSPKQAYTYYTKAYEYNNKNPLVLSNIARYLIRVNDIENAKKFLYLVLLNSRSKTLLAEVYYSLSTIALTEFNFSYAEKYAKESIKNFPSYFPASVSLARVYYFSDFENQEEQIKKLLTSSIKNNPNGYEAYFYYGLYFYRKGDLENGYALVQTAADKIKKDPILMDYERKTLELHLYTINYFISKLLSTKTLEERSKIYTESVFLFQKPSYFTQFISLEIKSGERSLFYKFQEDNGWKNLISNIK